jgi:hypothetical protein
MLPFCGKLVVLNEADVDVLVGLVREFYVLLESLHDD